MGGVCDSAGLSGLAARASEVLEPVVYDACMLQAALY